MSESKTLGEIRVRTTFNPSDLNTVAQIKNKASELIDLINAIESKDNEVAG